MFLYNNFSHNLRLKHFYWIILSYSCGTMYNGSSETDLRPLIVPLITPSVNMPISLTSDQLYPLDTYSTKPTNDSQQGHSYYRSTSIQSSGLQLVNSFNPIIQSMNAFSEHLDCIIRCSNYWHFYSENRILGIPAWYWYQIFPLWNYQISR